MMARLHLKRRNIGNCLASTYLRSTLAFATLLFVTVASLSSSELSVPSAKFALSLYDVLKADKASTENIFFSPISISTVLSMTLLGAKGKTAEEVFSVLQYPLNFTHSQFGELTAALSTVDKDNVLLHIANKIFTKDGLNFLHGFTSGLTAHYLADAQALDFKRDPDGSRLLINQWVEEKTKTKIKDLLPDGCIDNSTAAVLVSAIYFQGDWFFKNKFNPRRTKPGDFKGSPYQTYRVNFMYATKNFLYGKNRDLGFHILQLPYKGKKLSMVVLLPFADDGLAALEGKLNADLLLKTVEETKITKVTVTLPKFKIQDSIDLKEKLGSMGIVELFSNQADLSGITEDVPLKVSEAFQKSFIEVNEEGSEAAAATGLQVFRLLKGNWRDPMFFTADHPFLFGIFDKRTRLFLFWGRIAHPTSIDGKRNEL